MGCFPFRPSVSQREHGDQVRVKFKLYIQLWCVYILRGGNVADRLLTKLSNNPFRMENSVRFLQNINFSQLTLSEKTEIKERGRATPGLSIEQKSTSKGQAYTRHFNIAVYQKYEWICGNEANALFCFPCMFFGGDLTWTKSGVKYLKHLQDLKHPLSTTISRKFVARSHQLIPEVGYNCVLL